MPDPSGAKNQHSSIEAHTRINMAITEKAQIFMPPISLKAKAGSASGTLTVDPEALKNGEKAMEGLRREFSDWLAEDIATLAKTFAVFAKAPTADNAGALFRAAHDLKGQATTFEYPLIARVAASLAKLMDGMQSWEAAPLPLVAAHVDAIHVIHRDKIKDISNRIALTLAEELEGRVLKTIAQASFKQP
jgi:HPt (histidine-containing phosphotransfer) domain-containing protein